jgi:hypothetical protein
MTTPPRPLHALLGSRGSGAGLVVVEHRGRGRWPPTTWSARARATASSVAEERTAAPSTRAPEGIDCPAATEEEAGTLRIGGVGGSD